MSGRQYVLLVLALALGACLAFFYRTPSYLESKAEFGNVSLRIEYALTPAERARGLGGRETLPTEFGMLFVFAKDGSYGFWMKDTLVPLDIFWLDSQGQVVSIASDVATSSYPHVFYPTKPARYVLETAAGFAVEHGIAAGAALKLKSFPTVSE